MKKPIRTAILSLMLLLIAHPSSARFCSNDPINNTDPLGLLTESQVTQMFAAQSAVSDKAVFIDQLLQEGYSIYSDDFSKVIREPKEGVRRKKAAFIVMGGNTKDPSLFTRGAKVEIAELEKTGHDVNTLVVTEELFYSKRDRATQAAILPKLNAAQSIRDALTNIRELSRISIYSHGQKDINLTNYGADLASQRPSAQSQLAAYRVYIGDLTIDRPAADGDHIINIFACMSKDATWGSSWRTQPDGRQGL